MNASFGADDGLQQLQRVADDLRYESARICEAARACSDRSKQLINYPRTRQRTRQREKQRIGAEIRPCHVLALYSPCFSLCPAH